jgi:hypothetical protein
MGRTNVIPSDTESVAYYLRDMLIAGQRAHAESSVADGLGAVIHGINTTVEALLDLLEEPS